MREWIDLITEGAYDEDDDDIAPDFGKGLWIKPDGTVDWTDYENDVHHGDLVAGEFDPQGNEEFVAIAMRHGWIRVRWHDDGAFIVEVDPTSTITRTALRVLRKFASEHQGPDFIVEVPGGYKKEATVGGLMIALRRYIESQTK